MKRENSQPLFVDADCDLCGKHIEQNLTGEPFLEFKNKDICSDCCFDLIPEIYKMAGGGDGGMIHLSYYSCLQSRHNKKHRATIHNYAKTLDKLLHKYKFMCVKCGSKDRLEIDHIKPVSKGGTDDLSNLQILCKHCNCSKGAKYDG